MKQFLYLLFYTPFGLSNIEKVPLASPSRASGLTTAAETMGSTVASGTGKAVPSTLPQAWHKNPMVK